MPKYTSDIIVGYSLYFTSKCIVEAMHVHAGDKKMDRSSSAKLFVYENGETKIERWGMVNKTDMPIIQAYIKNNYEEMCAKWSKYSDNGFYSKP